MRNQQNTLPTPVPFAAAVRVRACDWARIVCLYIFIGYTAKLIITFPIEFILLTLSSVLCVSSPELHLAILPLNPTNDLPSSCFSVLYMRRSRLVDSTSFFEFFEFARNSQPSSLQHISTSPS